MKFYYDLTSVKRCGMLGFHRRLLLVISSYMNSCCEPQKIVPLKYSRLSILFAALQIFAVASITIAKMPQRKSSTHWQSVIARFPGITIPVDQQKFLLSICSQVKLRCTSVTWYGRTYSKHHALLSESIRRFLILLTWSVNIPCLF